MVVGIELCKVRGVDILLLHPCEALVDEVCVVLNPDDVVGLPTEQVLHHEQELVSQQDILFLQGCTQDITLNDLPIISAFQDCCLPALDLDADACLLAIPPAQLQLGRATDDDLQEFQLVLVDAVKIMEVVHEVPKQHVQVLVRLSRRLIQTHSQRVIHKQDSLTDILHPHQAVPVDVAGKEEGTADATVLAMHVHSGVLALREAVDSIEGKHQLVEGEVGVHGKAEVMHFSLLGHLQQLLLHPRIVFVLTHVPYLKLALADVRPELGDVVGLGKLDMVDLREDLSDVVFAEDLAFDLGVVIRYILFEALHCFVVLELTQHADKRSEHLPIILLTTHQYQAQQLTHCLDKAPGADALSLLFSLQRIGRTGQQPRVGEGRYDD